MLVMPFCVFRQTLPEISDKMATACLVYGIGNTQFAYALRILGIRNLHAYDTYAMAFDFYQEIHRTRTFFQKLQSADSLDTVCRPLDQ